MTHENYKKKTMTEVEGHWKIIIAPRYRAHVSYNGELVDLYHYFFSRTAQSITYMGLMLVFDTVEVSNSWK